MHSFGSAVHFCSNLFLAIAEMLQLVLCLKMSTGISVDCSINTRNCSEEVSGTHGNKTAGFLVKNPIA